MQNAFLKRLASGKVLLLDGATGTELDRRGADTRLPLWSARVLIENPDLLRAIQMDYVAAGADILTTNTFRTHRRTLTRAGAGERTHELTQSAVQIAREAAWAADRQIFIAGSMSPLEDCYSPQLVPPDAELQSEHAEMARDLAEVGCDLLLVETMNTIREAVIAARCAAATGLPVCVSFVVGPGGRPPDQIVRPRDESSAQSSASSTPVPLLLLSAETIAAAVAAMQPLNPVVILTNCVPLAFIDRALDELRAAHRGPIGLYANIGHADDQTGWKLTEDVLPEAYARCAQQWLRNGAAIVGGCCGTTPDHIAAIRQLLKRAA